MFGNNHLKHTLITIFPFNFWLVKNCLVRSDCSPIYTVYLILDSEFGIVKIAVGCK